MPPVEAGNTQYNVVPFDSLGTMGLAHGRPPTETAMRCCTKLMPEIVRGKPPSVGHADVLFAVSAQPLTRNTKGASGNESYEKHRRLETRSKRHT
jgi:hypothetical protein